MKSLLLAILFVFLGCCTLGGCQTGTALRVVAYNIRHGHGMDDRIDLQRVAELIRRWKPDIVTLQEIDRGAERSDGVDQARRLGELTGMHHAFGAFMDYQGGEYGMAVLSRFAVLESVNHRLPGGTEPRTALAVRVKIAPDGPEVVVVGVHLYRTAAERLAQADAMIEALADETAPVILAGDFNSLPDDPVMQRLAAHYTNIAKRPPEQTFPSTAPEREIDYFLVRPADRILSVEARVIDERIASDHRPILMNVRIR